MYTVQPGDWLSRIASRQGVTLTALLDANDLTVNSLIVPGQQLRIPRQATGGSGGGSGGGAPSRPAGPPAAGPIYTVRPGDSLGAIATQHDISLDALLAVNGFTRNSLITPSMPIRLPVGAALTRVDRMLNYTLAQVGKPYKFWTRGPDFFDCSGLTVAAYAQIGVSLIHHSATQATQGTEVDFVNEAIRAGDLVFQDTDGDGVINHVGIALGDTTWVHAREHEGCRDVRIDAARQPDRRRTPVHPRRLTRGRRPARSRPDAVASALMSARVAADDQPRVPGRQPRTRAGEADLQCPANVAA